MSETIPNTSQASQDDRTIAMLTHLSGIILGFIVPLIVWLIHKPTQPTAF